MFLDGNPKRKRRFGEDNVVRTQDGEVMILPSYTPDPSYPFTNYTPDPTYPFDIRETYFPEQIISDHYDPLLNQVVSMDGITSGGSKSYQAISWSVITQPEINWVTSHSKFILYGLIGLGILFMLRRRLRGSEVEEKMEDIGVMGG